MPELYKYLSAFGLVDQAIISGYQLHLNNPQEVTIARNHEYRYTGMLDFYPTASANQEQLFAHFTNLINQHLEVYGIRYPYDCTLNITSITIDPTSRIIRMVMEGHSQRV